MFTKENPDGKKWLPFPTIHIVTIIVTMLDNNTFNFDKCNVGIKSGFKKKT